MESERLVFLIFNYFTCSHILEQTKDLEVLARVEGSRTDADWVHIGFLPDADKLVATFMKKQSMFVVFLIWIENLLTEEYWQIHF